MIGIHFYVLYSDDNKFVMEVFYVCQRSWRLFIIWSFDENKKGIILIKIRSIAILHNK